MKTPSHPDPKRPQHCNDLAEAGDPWTLLRALQSDKDTVQRWDAGFTTLLAALERRASEAPEIFSAEMLAQIMATASYIYLRTQMHVVSQIQRGDEAAGYSIAPGLSGCEGNAIPRLLEIGRYIAEIAHVQAATARQWALARAKLPLAERAAKQPIQPRGGMSGHAKKSAWSASNDNGKQDVGGRLAAPPSVPRTNGHCNGKTKGSADGRSKPPGPAPVNRLEDRRNGSPPPA